MRLTAAAAAAALARDQLAPEQQLFTTTALPADDVSTPLSFPARVIESGVAAPTRLRTAFHERSLFLQRPCLCPYVC
jgi:hypothetical protein